VAAQRFLWNNAPRFGIYRVNWNIIRQDTFVTVTAAEARLGPAVPDRFIGGARPVLVGSVAPQNGFVEFSMWWGLMDISYLNIWTDVLVF